MKNTYAFFLFMIIAAASFGQVPPPPPPPPPPPAPIEELIQVVEDMPMFPGCEEVEDKAALKKCSDRKMLEFIYSNLKYPKIAKENGVEGMVVVRFVVEKDGKISNPEVVRDIGASCGEEALRIVKLMPKWIPGKQNGKAIKVQYNLPVRFKIGQNENLKKINSNKEKIQNQKEPIKFEANGTAPPPTRKNRIFRVVEEMPTFPGCEDEKDKSTRKKCADRKMLEHTYENILYPQEARDKKVEGMVIIRFIVEIDGSISNAEIVRDIGAGCGEEALRVVNLMPKWNPGTMRGEPVAVQFNMPINFKLGSKKKR